jgi:hypothetical protein
MNAINVFLHALKSAHQLFKSEYARYNKSFLSLVVIGFISAIPFKFFGVHLAGLDEVTEIIGSFISLIFIVNIIMIEKARFYKRDKEKLLYSAPTFLIYTFYSTLLMAAGPIIVLGITKFLALPYFLQMALAGIPGVVVGLLVSFVPYASVLIDNDSVNYFKISFRMTTGNWGLAFLVFFSALALEILPLIFELIQNPLLKSVSLFLFAFVNAYFYVIFSISFVKIFFAIKK